MTTEVNDTIERYTISGVGPYSFSSRIFNAAELAVFVDPGALNPVPLSISTHYTVTGVNAAAGGSITLTAPTATLYAGQTLDIRSNTTEYQPTSIRNQGSFLPSLHEDAFDRLSRQIQDLSRRTRGSLRLPDTTLSDAVMSPLSAWAGKYPFINANGEFEPATAVALTTLTQAVVASLLYPQTGAEIAAGVTPTNYAFPQGDVRRYGAVGNGVTNDAAAINNALLIGGDVSIPPLTFYLGTTALSVSSGTRVIMAAGGKFTANTATVGNMPMAYVVADGSNIELNGLFLDFSSTPYVAYIDRGTFIQIKSGSSGIKVLNCRSRWPMHSVYGVCSGAVTSAHVSNVEISGCEFVSHDADIYWNAHAPANWDIHDNVFATQRPQELRNGGAIYFAPAVQLETGGVGFDQADYDGNCGLDIQIHDNTIKDVVGRPLRLHNCRRIYVTNNSLKLKHGTFSDADVCDDAITCEMLRTFTVQGNTVEGGGENALDLQSCQDGVVSGNTFKECNTVAIGIAPSDLWITSVTSPKLNGITDRGVINSKNIEIVGNYIHSYHGVLFLGSGQNVHIHGNTWKVYTGSTYNDGTTAPLPFSIDTAPGAAHFNEGHQYWMHDIRMRGNKHATNPWVSVTANAGTDVLTTTAGSHEFQTGDPIELVPSGSSTTVDMPGGLTYSTTYYVIRASATSFKLATTRPLAFAGTAVNISSNGLGTAGAALIIKDAVYRTQLSVSPSHYGPDSRLELDGEFPYDYFVTAFSSFPLVHATSTTVMLPNVKNEFVFDPAATYGGGPSTKTNYPNRWPIDERITSDGTDEYGIQATDVSRGAVVLTAAGKISQYPGISASGSIRTTIW